MARWLRSSLKCRGQRGERGVTTERNLAAYHFIEDDAKGKYVRTCIDRFALGLLGRHVGWRAHDLTASGERGLCQPRRSRFCVFVDGPRIFCDSEIENLHARIRNHDVSGLEIAMHDPVRVRRAQCIRDLRGMAQGIREWQRTSLQQLPKCFAPDQFHDQIVGADVVDRANVRVVERRERTAFEFEPSCQALWHDLDCDQAIQPCVSGSVDLAHPSCPERGLDFIRTDR